MPQIRVFRVFVPTAVFVLLISEFLLLLFCYVLAAFVVLPVDPWVFLLYDGGLLRLLLVVLAIMFGLHVVFDRYSDLGTRSRMALVLDVLAATGLAYIVQGMVGYARPSWILPRWTMAYGSLFSVVCLAGWRVIYGTVVYPAFGTQRILFLGWSPIVEEIAQYLAKHREAGLTNVGYADDAHAPGTMLDGAPVLGPVRSLREIAGQTKPDRIVVGMSERRTRLPVQDLLDLKFSGILVEDASLTNETLCGRISTKELRPSQLIFSGELGPRRGRVLLQSLYSLAIAVIATIVLTPLMLLVAAAIKLTSRGPALYRQTRVGLNGKTFVLNKFRSMYSGAEAETGAVWATKDDPRVTRLGRWLRKLRLDELPQLFNVLRGEMSIVGPRPERPEFVKLLAGQIPYYPQRQCVKPGITGWAQINYRYGETVEDAIVKLEHDLFYIKHLSPALDAYIIFQTLKTVLRLRGAQ